MSMGSWYVKNILVPTISGQQDNPTTAQPLQYQQQAPLAPPLSNPMSRINPFYTQAQPMDALAPLQMLQQYRQTGQAPQAQSSFQPWSNPAASQSAAPSSLPVIPGPTGGK